MSKWRDTTLGEVIQLQRGFDLTEKSSTPGPYPVISSSGPGYSTTTPKVAGPGVVTGRKGVLGKVFFCSGSYWPHDTTLWVKDFRGSDPRFVYYLLQTLPLASLDAGAANPTLNRNHAHLLPVRVPDPATQRLVSTVLSAMDDLIENSLRRIKLLEQMAQAIYREWFVRFRYPGHEGARLVDSPLGPIPNGWKIDHLGAVAKVNAESRTPRSDETIHYLDISSVSDRSLTTPQPLQGSDAPGRARRVVRPGDIVWSMVRPGRRAHSLLLTPTDAWIASTGFAVLRPAGVPSAFLFELVSAPEFTDYLVSREGGSAYPAVKPSDFEAAPILKPPQAIVAAFSEAVGPMHRLVWSLRETSETLASVRDRLLPGLVTGRIDVSALDLDALVGWVA